MARLVKIYGGSTGINTKIDPVRFKYDAEAGMQELTAGVNVDIDSTGRIGRRKGYTLKLAVASHSLFPCDGYCLFVTDNALSVLEPDYTHAPIRNVTVGAKVRYVAAGGDVYYLNGHEKGIVRDRVSYGWTAADYVGPPTTKVFSDPPIGHLLELYNGVMMIAEDNVLWYSEPFTWSWFDLARSYFPLIGRLTMVKAVKGGVFVSTKYATFFYRGQDVKGLEQVKVANYPAIEGTEVTVEASRLGDGSIKGVSAMWATPKGVCFGGPDGAFENLTERKLNYPAAKYGAGLYRNGKYICLLQP